jgi:hypothetical protein
VEHWHPSEEYCRAIAALRFFALVPEKQLQAFEDHRGEIPLFGARSGSPGVGDFLVAVYGVFTTYLGAIYDQFQSSEEAERVNDFRHHLNVLACPPDADVWCADGILLEEWAELRRRAADALSELKEPATPIPPQFDFAEWINPDEFRTSDEARRLLG